MKDSLKKEMALRKQLFNQIQELKGERASKQPHRSQRTRACAACMCAHTFMSHHVSRKHSCLLSCASHVIQGSSRADRWTGESVHTMRHVNRRRSAAPLDLFALLPVVCVLVCVRGVRVC